MPMRAPTRRSSCSRSARLGELPHFFDVERFSVNVERRFNADGAVVAVSEAIVKVRVDGEALISAAEGNGPVNALDLALAQGSRQVSAVHRGYGTASIIACASSRAARMR